MRLTTLAAVGLIFAVAACGGADTDSTADTDVTPDRTVRFLDVATGGQLCGTTVVVHDDGNRLALASFDSGRAERIRLDVPADGRARPAGDWEMRAQCAKTPQGPVAVVTYAEEETLLGTADESSDGPVGVFGVRLDGTVRWYHDMAPSQEVTVANGSVLLAESRHHFDGGPTATMLDAATGKVLIDDKPLASAAPVSADRIAYVDSEPKLADGKLESIGSLHWALDEATGFADWIPADGVAVLLAADIIGVDTRSGKDLWSVAADDTVQDTKTLIDPESEVLLTTADLSDPDLPPAAEAPSDAVPTDVVTLSGIDIESGEVRWRRELPDGTVKFAGGGMFGFDADSNTDATYYDSSTGEALDRPDGVVIDAGTEGLLVHDVQELRLIDIDSLR